MRTVQTLTLADALLAQEAGGRCATEQGLAVSIAVVDRAGGLVALHTMDGTQPAGPDVAVAKARAAALFRRPSAAFERDAADLAKPSIMWLTSAVEHALPVQGGVPVAVDGDVAGAVGVSGGTGRQDAEIADRAAAAVVSSAGTARAVIR